MDKIGHAGHAGGEVEMPTDLLASLLIERASAPAPKRPHPYRVPAKIYAVMVLTSLLTFATLTTGYQLLFSHQVFA